MAIDRTRFRKKVTAPLTGQEFEIRKVHIGEFMRDIGDLPVSSSASLTEQLKLLEDKMTAKLANDPDGEKKIRRFFLEKGIVEPKIYFGPDAECPEDQICEIDLASDANFLIGQIAEFSFHLRGLEELSAFLLRTGANDTGHGSEEIRQATVAAIAEGNGSPIAEPSV